MLKLFPFLKKGGNEELEGSINMREFYKRLLEINPVVEVNSRRFII
jgi:hypothetical protein